MLRRPIAIRAAILACVVAAAAWAADVTGKWSGDIGGPDGGMTLTATFKQDGTKLTGTIDGPGGGPCRFRMAKWTATRSCSRWPSTI